MMEIVLYVYMRPKRINIDEEPNPFDVKEIGIFIPAHITRRIVAQAGVFTIHANPRKAFDSSDIEMLTIKNEARRQIKRDLYKYGIHQASLFPDLDALSKHITWLRSDEH